MEVLARTKPQEVVLLSGILDRSVDWRRVVSPFGSHAPHNFAMTSSFHLLTADFSRQLATDDGLALQHVRSSPVLHGMSTWASMVSGVSLLVTNAWEKRAVRRKVVTQAEAKACYGDTPFTLLVYLGHVRVEVSSRQPSSISETKDAAPGQHRLGVTVELGVPALSDRLPVHAVLVGQESGVDESENSGARPYSTLSYPGQCVLLQGSHVPFRVIPSNAPSGWHPVVGFVGLNLGGVRPGLPLDIPFQNTIHLGTLPAQPPFGFLPFLRQFLAQHLTSLKRSLVNAVRFIQSDAKEDSEVDPVVGALLVSELWAQLRTVHLVVAQATRAAYGWLGGVGSGMAAPPGHFADSGPRLSVDFRSALPQVAPSDSSHLVRQRGRSWVLRRCQREKPGASVIGVAGARVPEQQQSRPIVLRYQAPNGHRSAGAPIAKEVVSHGPQVIKGHRPTIPLSALSAVMLPSKERIAFSRGRARNALSSRQAKVRELAGVPSAQAGGEGHGAARSKAGRSIISLLDDDTSSDEEASGIETPRSPVPPRTSTSNTGGVLMYSNAARFVTGGARSGPLQEQTVFPCAPVVPLSSPKSPSAQKGDMNMYEREWFYAAFKPASTSSSHRSSILSEIGAVRQRMALLEGVIEAVPPKYVHILNSYMEQICDLLPREAVVALSDAPVNTLVGDLESVSVLPSSSSLIPLEHSPTHSSLGEVRSSALVLPAVVGEGKADDTVLWEYIQEVMRDMAGVCDVVVALLTSKV